MRQFIYAVIVVVTGFIAFKIALVAWYVALPLVPPMLLFAVLAAPFGHDQPSEIWLLAKIRFFLKPRRRIWDQSGIKQLVAITVPKKPEKHYGDGLSQNEVRSRLRALADTIDSRGWAIKNVNVNLSARPALAMAEDGSDRLIDVSSLPQEVSNIDVMPSDDIMDPLSNPRARQLEQMIIASAQSHRQEAVNRMKQPAHGTEKTSADEYWFMHPNDTAEPEPALTTFNVRTVAPGADQPSQLASPQLSPEEAAVLQHIRKQKQDFPTAAYGQMKVIDPLGQRKPAPPISPQPVASQAADDRQQTTNGSSAVAPDDSGQTTVAGQPATEPAILELASNDDLNVATLAREAGRNQRKRPPSDEVVISLR